MVLLSLLANDLFNIRKAQLREVIKSAEILLIIIIYILLSLRGRLPIYIIKSVCTFIYNKVCGKIKEINRFIYL
jgi:hypothetical protein